MRPNLCNETFLSLVKPTLCQVWMD